MKRDYDNGHFGEEVKVFVGPEIEHTPAYGRTTLFLATNSLTTDQILELSIKNKCEAVYFGANRCFQNNIANQEVQVNKILNQGYYVTIDYPYAEHKEVKRRFADVWKHEKFIPFCSIIFPRSEDDDNLCVKVDDVDFNSTNPGVWTMTMDHFKQSAGFTSWREYKKDKILDVSEWTTHSTGGYHA